MSHQTLETETVATRPAQVTVRNGGAGRGARLMLSGIHDFNDRSSRFNLRMKYADPMPEKAAQLAEEGRLFGIDAEPIEGRIEDVLGTEGPNETTPIILNLDRPAAVGAAIQTAVGQPRALLAYQLVRMPGGRLAGVAVVLQGNEDDLKRQGAMFFRALGEVTARSGAAYVVGERGRPEHIAVEPAYRAWFTDHMHKHLSKVIGGVEPESAPFSLTFDGQRTMPLLIHDNRSAWGDAVALASDLAKRSLKNG